MSKSQRILRLASQLSEIEKSIDHCEKVNLDISKKGVDWHSDHMLKVINGTYRVLNKSNPDDYKWHFNFIRFLVFLIRYFPRGKGRAPKVVTSEGVVAKERLIEQLGNAKNTLIDLESLPKKSNFKHPYFGLLDLNMSLNFLVIHTEHHLKIVRDILNSDK